MELRSSYESPYSAGELWAPLQCAPDRLLNLTTEFSAVARRHMDDPAIITARRTRPLAAIRYQTLTFRQCQELTARYAAYFRSEGVEKGSKALVLMKPMPDFAPVFLALWSLEAVPVAFDRGPSRMHTLRSIERAAAPVMVAIPEAHVLRVLFPRTFHTVQKALWVGPGCPAHRQRRTSAAATPPRTCAGDSLAVVFTSGSTGPAKGVIYTHCNGAAIASAMREVLSIGPGSMCLASHPAFAIYFLGSGATAVMPPIDPRFPLSADPSLLLTMIRDLKVEVAFLQIPIIRNLWKHCVQTDQTIPYVRRIMTTGAAVPPEVISGIRSVLEQPGADLDIMYGATEALAMAFTTGREVLAKAHLSGAGFGTYLGRPFRTAKIRILAISDDRPSSIESARELPAGEIGEICVCGPMVSAEYLGSPEANRTAKIPCESGGPWHRTGDAGYFDEHGDLWFCGRIADRVPARCGHLYSHRVEPLFDRHPDVFRSALIGVPIPGMREKNPVLVVEPRPDRKCSDELLAEGLRAIANQHSVAERIATILIHREPFPVDIRHGSKIRRDLLSLWAVDRLSRKSVFSERKSIRFRGYRVSYREAGAGEPIVFLHNAGNDGTIWERQVDFFSGRYRTIAVDSLGYGASDRPGVEYSLPLYTEMVRAIVEELALEPVTFIATCTGAAMALNYALQSPERVRRLLLFHIATRASVRGGSLEGITGLLRERRRLRGLLAPLIGKILRLDRIQDRVVRGQYGLEMRDERKFLEHLKELGRSPRQAESLLRLFSNWDSFAPLDELEYPREGPPLHLFWGDSNRVLPVARGRELYSTLKPLTFDVIEGAGHLAMREQPDLVNDKLAARIELPAKALSAGG